MRLFLVSSKNHFAKIEYYNLINKSFWFQNVIFCIFFLSICRYWRFWSIYLNLLQHIFTPIYFIILLYFKSLNYILQNLRTTIIEILNSLKQFERFILKLTCLTKQNDYLVWKWNFNVQMSTKKNYYHSKSFWFEQYAIIFFWNLR